jgi:hypothetical protein
MRFPARTRAVSLALAGAVLAVAATVGLAVPASARPSARAGSRHSGGPATPLTPAPPPAS